MTRIVQIVPFIGPGAGVPGVAWNLDRQFRAKGIETETFTYARARAGRREPRARGRRGERILQARRIVWFSTIGTIRATAIPEGSPRGDRDLPQQRHDRRHLRQPWPSPGSDARERQHDVAVLPEPGQHLHPRQGPPPLPQRHPPVDRSAHRAREGCRPLRLRWRPAPHRDHPQRRRPGTIPAADPERARRRRERCSASTPTTASRSSSATSSTERASAS